MSTDSQARVYRGSSVEELIPRIQRELGGDAIILRRREGLAGGILGFFQRSFVEIEAVRGGPRIDVYDEGEGESIAHSSPPPGLPLMDVARTAVAPANEQQSVAPVSAYATPNPPGGALAAHGSYVTKQLAALATASRREVTPPPERHLEADPPAARFVEPPSPHPRESFATALASAELRPPRSSSAGVEPWSVPPPQREGGRADANIEKRLLRVGISAGFARELIDGARAHVLPVAHGGGLTRAVRASLAQRIPVVAPPLAVRGSAIVVIGPGGSGKTSYCAALMRAYRQRGTVPASYAALTWSPDQAGLHLLLSPHVMWPTPISAARSRRALRRVRGEGLLVIDTPPLSPVDRAAIRELGSLLGDLAPDRVMVALPATLGATAGAQLLEALRPLEANAMVVTHTDETDQLGVAVEAACGFGLAPEYLLDRGRAGGWRVGRTDPAAMAERLLS